MVKSNYYIKLCYLWSDGPNCCFYKEMVFSNRNNLTLEFINVQIRNELSEDDLFDPFEWGLPDLTENYEDNYQEHYHEFLKVGKANNFDLVYGTIEGFLKKIKTQVK